MIHGIGVDCTQVERVAKSLERPSFLKRMFSAGEQAMLESLRGKRRTESAAACFAAKEAFLKAVGTGFSGGFALAEIGALRNEAGAPYYAFDGEAARYMRQNNLRAHLSLTHEAGLAIAFAILEKD